MKQTQNARLKHLIVALTYGLYGLVMGVAHRFCGEYIRFIINGLYND